MGLVHKPVGLEKTLGFLYIERMLGVLCSVFEINIYKGGLPCTVLIGMRSPPMLNNSQMIWIGLCKKVVYKSGLIISLYGSPFA